MFKSVFIAVLLSLSAHLWADDSEQPSFAFDHVALSVADVDTSVVFYEALFGMTNITDREPIDGVRWLSMQGGGEMHLLAIVDGDVVTNQAVHLAVRTSGFDQLMSKIESMDVEYTTWLNTEPGVTVRDDGTRQIYVRDPDGYWIEVIGVAD
jgi:catechol 2,3-dioxygenase-like lactoylglutathione lyase family enzyme